MAQRVRNKYGYPLGSQEKSVKKVLAQAKLLSAE